MSTLAISFRRLIAVRRAALLSAPSSTATVRAFHIFCGTQSYTVARYTQYRTPKQSPSYRLRGFDAGRVFVYTWRLPFGGLHADAEPRSRRRARRWEDWWIAEGARRLRSGSIAAGKATNGVTAEYEYAAYYARRYNIPLYRTAHPCIIYL